MKSTFICPVLSAGCLTMFTILYSHIAPAHGKASSEDGFNGASTQTDQCVCISVGIY